MEEVLGSFVTVGQTPAPPQEGRKTTLPYPTLLIQGVSQRVHSLHRNRSSPISFFILYSRVLVTAGIGLTYSHLILTPEHLRVQATCFVTINCTVRSNCQHQKWFETAETQMSKWNQDARAE
ncbi:unnamed protein product [Enterobius vermicularis]|uniref:Uncharacterized protein n=1 Tax=Enterobius vermicularis TaxID=51028 RepID=A0A0N4VR89_ENTVE|nr:unnamed protein product [Enterobius vermicularis]